ncbi:MAG: ABC transporter ATP-binding protein [Burkholderiales bacterium]
MLRAEKISLSVPGRSLYRDLDIELRPGQCWCILGCNGSGKTTLLHALSGLTRPAAGSIELDGLALSGLPAKAAARKIGVLLQDESPNFWGTVLEYVLLGRFPHAHGLGRLHGEDEIAARLALQAMDMAGHAERYLNTLSGGERQRVRIAMVLAQDPDYFFLDEPLQHLDLAHQLAVMEIFRAQARERGKTVVMVLHDTLWPGRYCDHALLLHDGGRAVGGAASALLTRDELQTLYRCALHTLETPHGPYFVPA